MSRQDWTGLIVGWLLVADCSVAFVSFTKVVTYVHDVADVIFGSKKKGTLMTSLESFVHGTNKTTEECYVKKKKERKKESTWSRSVVSFPLI